MLLTSAASISARRRKVGRWRPWSSPSHPVPELLEPPGDGRLRVLLLGNIHSGECDGKEALLMLLRELAQQPDHPWLKHLVLVFVPNYNADANDRMRKDNRPGQVGPDEGMGERANAQDFDLNRDFVKIEALETQCLIALVNRVGSTCCSSICIRPTVPSTDIP